MLTLLTLLVVPLCGFIVSESAFAQSPPTQEEMQALAPTGKLRAALYLGGPTNVVKDPSRGKQKGWDTSLEKNWRDVWECHMSR